MKLLVDAQLPPRLCTILDGLGLESLHVSQLPNGNQTTDQSIIEFADKNDYTVATKDTDFYHSYMTQKKPKKLFLITTGNLRNRDLIDLIRNNAPLLLKALESSSLIELNNEGIIEY